MSNGIAPLRERLRSELTAAMKRRDRAAMSTLRATLAAIDNAEAVDAGDVRAGAVETSAVGVGTAEVARRALTEADIAAIVVAEIAERESAAVEFDCNGAADRAAELRHSNDVLRAALD